MNNIFGLLILLAGVGAVVGAATNYMAIKMLFRPYKPIYFMRWRLPLTPGLIPKRRDVLAIQLGKMVSDYLLTPSTIKKKFLSDNVRRNVLAFAQEKVTAKIFTKDKSLNDWLKLANFHNTTAIVEQKIDAVIANQFSSIKNVLATKTIQQLMPTDLAPVLDKKIGEAVDHILDKGVIYFQSPEGTRTIKNLLDDFLSSKGSFGGMIQMFMGDSLSLVEKVQRELIRFLQAPGTNAMLYRIFFAEWEKLKERKAMDFLSDVNFNTIEESVQTYAKQQLALDERLDQTIHHYWPQGQAWVNDELLPKIMDKTFIAAEGKIEDVLQRLNIAEVVREQVDSFPIAKLEELILGIISSELRMITWLGGIIGGIVGIVQALIVYMTN